jgi:hypothetical protein
MEVNNIRTPGTLVEVIDILGDDGHLKDILKLLESLVGCIWLYSKHAFPPLIVEPKNPCGITLPSFGSSNNRNGLPLPQTSWSTKGIEPALCANSCP